MTDLLLNNFNTQEFLKDVWQQKPQFFKNALPDYDCPINGDDLASLSLDADIESRLIIEQPANHWHLENGPFDESRFSSLPDSNWTLLVQAVDHLSLEIADLKEYFKFIPTWRLDDIMISYAVKGGSVGPHFDQYDVFLLQASGSRRWQLGQQASEKTTLVENTDLCLLKNFESTKEHIATTGDILYIPPGVPHWGVSESDDCITISIGFRAPSKQELMDQCLHDISEISTEFIRYNDTSLEAMTDPASITTEQLERMTQSIKASLTSDIILKSFGKLVTEPKYPTYPEVFDDSQPSWSKKLDARIAYSITDESLLIFANGQLLSVEKSLELFVKQACNEYLIITSTLDTPEKQLLQKLVTHGIFEPSDPSE